jgi:hypothetical protein
MVWKSFVGIRVRSEPVADDKFSHNATKASGPYILYSRLLASFRAISVCVERCWSRQLHCSMQYPYLEELAGRRNPGHAVRASHPKVD